jgi:hypothetical protein
MKFKAPGLVALILTMAVLVQVLFVRTTGAHTADGAEPARIARFETLLESLRQELKIPSIRNEATKGQLS